jgi:hypothetical protein
MASKFEQKSVLPLMVEAVHPPRTPITGRRAAPPFIPMGTIWVEQKGREGRRREEKARGR